MGLRPVALIEAEPEVKRELRNIFQPLGIEIVSVSENCVHGSIVSQACAFIIGIRDKNPSQTRYILSNLRRVAPGIPILLLAWASSEQLAITALKLGVVDYFSPPIDFHEVAEAVFRCIDYISFAGNRHALLDCPSGAQPIIGKSPAVTGMRDYVAKIAKRDCNALVLGETGTGKDLIAQAIHSNSARRAKPFVSVNCAAIPDTLLESELFGYEKGAFTGADGRAEGKLQQAQGGTVFLDEIGDMSPHAQAKILRVIESRQIQRLGGRASVTLDVRIVAATNQDLAKLMSEQRFRKDLFFRLNVAQIHVPPFGIDVKTSPPCWSTTLPFSIVRPGRG